MSQYLDDKTIQDIENYLAGIDEEKSYLSFQVDPTTGKGGIQDFLLEITKNIQIPLRMEVDGKYTGVQVYSLLDIIQTFI